jgi:hypothetical protein
LRNPYLKLITFYSSFISIDRFEILPLLFSYDFALEFYGFTSLSISSIHLNKQKHRFDTNANIDQLKILILGLLF